jgi:hypothetical protein
MRATHDAGTIFGLELKAMQKSLSIIMAVLFLVAMRAVAAEPQQQDVLWPDAEHPVLRITFSRFKDLGGSVGSQRPFAIDTMAENLSDKLVSSEHFTLYVLDRKQIRIGETWMTVSNLGPGQTVKFQTSVMASGTPYTVQVVALSAAQKAITLTVNSVPQGALLKVDDEEAGTTPRLISIGPGKHRLSFSKDGFRAGVFPLEIGASDVSGGSVSFELGAAQFDTIELRDGTVLNGDLNSVEGMDVVVRVGGELQRIDRNKVKRILLVEREAPEPSSLPPVEPKQ